MLMTAPREGVRQFAYATREETFDAAIAFWLDTMRVGPWFTLELDLTNQTFRGNPTGCTGRVALAMHGRVQLEILCATNDEPSPYSEWIEYKGSVPPAGLFHHFLIDTADYEATCSRLTSAGFGCAYRATLADGREMAYFDGREIVGSYVEVVMPARRSAAQVSAMRMASEAWDGVTDPIRSYGTLTDGVRSYL